MHSKRSHLTYALGTFVMGAALVLVGPVSAENLTTIDQSTQPHLKSWSNIIPNAAKRFVVLADFSNQAVLDRETGLVWEKSPEAITSTWEFALIECANKNVGGRKGWRLPSMPELASLIDPSVVPPDPTLPPAHPFANVQATRYWSATKVATFIEDQWNVNFYGGNVATAVADNDRFLFWCVRGPMNADAY